MRNQILTAIIASLISILGTLALATAGTVSRIEVEKMIRESEARTMSPVVELKRDQKEILQAVQQIQIDMAELKARGSK